MGGVNSTFGFRKFDPPCHGGRGMAILCVFADDSVSSDPDIRVIWRKGNILVKSTDYNNFQEASDIVTGLPPAKYTVETIIDGNSSGRRPFTINNPPPLKLEFRVKRYPKCIGCKSTVAAKAVGAKGAKTFSWYNVVNGKRVGKRACLTAKTGIYQVSVRDGNGCTASGTINLKPKAISYKSKCKK